MKTLLSWVFAAGVFGGVGALLTFTYLELHPEVLAPEHEGADSEQTGRPEKKGGPTASSSQPESQPGRPAAKSATGEKEQELTEVRTLDNGDVVVAMDEETQQRLGLIIQQLKQFKRGPEIVAYGVLQEDPAQSFTLRAPLAGYLQEGKDPWPQLGQFVKAGAPLGTIAPRLTPVERADMAQRLAAAQAEVDGQQAGLAAAREARDRQKKLFARQLTPEKSLQEAETAVQTNQAKLEGAQKAVEILRSAVTASTGPAGGIPLTVQQSGQVVLASARPGEAVESGQSLLQLATYERLLVRIEVPIGELASPEVKTARIIVPGHENEPIAARKIGLLPSMESRFGGQVLLFRAESVKLPIQPGMMVTAFLETPGETQVGVLVPRSAVVRYAGRSWVYVRSTDVEFLRQSAEVTHPEPGAIFVTHGLEPGAAVVVQGAQSLLIKELTFGASEEEE